MSNGINRAIIVGNVGSDPEIRTMQNGNSVASFSIATSESWKDKNTGEKKEATEWHRCSVFGKGAEIIQQYVKKGSKLYVEGKLKTDSFEKDGQKHYSTSIVVRDFQFLDSRSETGNSREQAPQQSQAPAQPGSFEDLYDSDIPF